MSAQLDVDTGSGYAVTSRWHMRIRTIRIICKLGRGCEQEYSDSAVASTYHWRIQTLRENGAAASELHKRTHKLGRELCCATSFLGHTWLSVDNIQWQHQEITRYTFFFMSALLSEPLVHDAPLLSRYRFQQIGRGVRSGKYVQNYIWSKLQYYRKYNNL